MCSEITHKAFRAMVPVDLPCTDVIELETCRSTYYFSNGVWLYSLESFVSCTTQYFVRDINA